MREVSFSSTCGGRLTLRRDHADRLGVVDAQHNAFADIELIMDAVLAAVSGLKMLAEDRDAGARIHHHAARRQGLEASRRVTQPQCPGDSELHAVLRAAPTHSERR